MACSGLALNGMVISLPLNFNLTPLTVTLDGEGVLPYMRYIGICGPKGYGFKPFWSQVNGIEFGYFGLRGCGLCVKGISFYRNCGAASVGSVTR